MATLQKKLIQFDWAIKSLLRDKANFDVLEGFLAALLEDESIQIIELLGQQDEEDKKFNQVDILVKDDKDRRIIIEVQTTRESDYLERLLFGTSKSIVENIGLGKAYKNIHKIISVSILFFNLGRGEDYLYHGTTNFVGMNDGKPLIIKRKEEAVINGQKVVKFEDRNIFPEYYLIRVEKYHNIIRRKIDEWIYLIKNDQVKEGSTSKNIDKAAKKLDFINMSEQEKKRYERFLINLHREKDILETAKEEGEAIGLKKAKKQIDKAQEATKKAQEKAQQAEEKAQQSKEKAQQAEEKAQQALNQATIDMIKNTTLSDDIIAKALDVPIKLVQELREKMR